MSLWFRLTGAFGAVILVALLIIAVIVNRATQSEFESYVTRTGQAWAEGLAPTLAAYYAQKGSWEGVNSLLRSSGTGMMNGMGGMMGPGATPNSSMMDSTMWAMMDLRVVLIDPAGRVLADSTGAWEGRTLPTSALAGAVPIQVQGKTVGLLLASSLGSTNGPAADFLNAVNRALLMAALVSGGLALLLGFLLFRQITAPLGALSVATDKIANGQLQGRVEIVGSGEFRRLGRSFNAMAARLERQEVVRRNLIADIAHELRNPIGVIQSELEGMLDGVLPLNQESVHSAHQETLLLTRLVDDLRVLSLADSGALVLVKTPTDMGELVRNSVAQMSTVAQEKGVTLTCAADAGLPRVEVDVDRMAQVLRNLISNAVRYTPEGNPVEVEARAKGDEIEVNVTDSGEGISSEDLTHVFDRFYRADKSRSRTSGGSGLGLAIVKQLVEAHGGRVGVSSEVGHGARFWFTVPAPGGAVVDPGQRKTNERR